MGLKLPPNWTSPWLTTHFVNGTLIDENDVFSAVNRAEKKAIRITTNTVDNQINCWIETFAKDDPYEEELDVFAVSCPKERIDEAYAMIEKIWNTSFPQKIQPTITGN